MYFNPLQAAYSLPHAATPLSTSSGASDPLSGGSSLFLQLLTTQLKNQSPFDPLDPNQFTAQLVQMNMLDQLSQINQTLQQIAGEAPAKAASTSSTSGSIPSNSMIPVSVEGAR